MFLDLAFHTRCPIFTLATLPCLLLLDWKLEIQQYHLNGSRIRVLPFKNCPISTKHLVILCCNWQILLSIRHLTYLSLAKSSVYPKTAKNYYGLVITKSLQSAHMFYIFICTYLMITFCNRNSTVTYLHIYGFSYSTYNT